MEVLREVSSSTHTFTLCLFWCQEDNQPAAAQGNLSLIDVSVCAQRTRQPYCEGVKSSPGLSMWQGLTGGG